MPPERPERNWRRFLLGLGVLLVVGIVMALESPSPAGVNPVISFFWGTILGYLIGWWVTGYELV